MFRVAHIWCQLSFSIFCGWFLRSLGLSKRMGSLLRGLLLLLLALLDTFLELALTRNKIIVTVGLSHRIE